MIMHDKIVDDHMTVYNENVQILYVYYIMLYLKLSPTGSGYRLHLQRQIVNQSRLDPMTFLAKVMIDYVMFHESVNPVLHYLYYYTL